ncbi:MAG: quinone oxidoreductase family protein [Longimicrobiales bacterium]
MNAIVIHRSGGPEVLQFEDAPLPEPAAGELRVRVSAAGLNFIDVYQRNGLYPQKLPFIPGSELAGVVDAVGAGVSRDRVGESVAIAHNAPVGAYAQYACIPAARAVTVPTGVGVRVAAAVMLQGMTAHYLALTTFPLAKGMTCVVHAAAGGVGLLLVQIARLQGARVIGTVSTEEKASLARGAGADEIIFYSRDDVALAVKRLTDGRGADVVYDSVGKNTFEQSLASLRPRGLLVCFGQSSGAIPPFDVLQLSRAGSLFLTRPTLGHYIATAEELQRRSGDLFRWILEGNLNVRIGAEFPLEQAAAAQRALEGRQTTGKVLLIP